MQDSVLKKEFKKKDVTRIRNLVKKNFNTSISIQAGYNKDFIEYKEGDIWEENNKTWTIRNGVRTSISKLQKFKEKYNTPLSCPCCGDAMKAGIDEKMWRLFEKCHKCVASYETQLRIEGKYESYSQNTIVFNKISQLKEAEAQLFELLNSGVSGFVNENGTIDIWDNNINKEKIQTELLDKITQLRKTLEDNIVK
jgi:hypothetical protein